MLKCFKKFKKKKYSRGEKSPLEHMHPQANFIEDMKKLNAKFGFKFDENHFFIVHYTAGNIKRTARDFFLRFLERGLCTYFIDGDGIIWQQHDGNRCGYHVGKTLWNGKGIARKCTGVEIACSGKLEQKDKRYYTWFNKEISENQVRYIAAGDGYTTHGFFHKYTPRQEKALAKLIAWHIAKGIPAENILGHDDVAYPKGRKSDPAGSLSMPIKDFVESKVMPLVANYQ